MKFGCFLIGRYNLYNLNGFLIEPADRALVERVESSIKKVFKCYVLLFLWQTVLLSYKSKLQPQNVYEIKQLL